MNECHEMQHFRDYEASSGDRREILTKFAEGKWSSRWGNNWLPGEFPCERDAYDAAVEDFEKYERARASA